ncbi:MAG: flagellar filament capping protein FliD [Alcaligenes sp.]
MATISSIGVGSELPLDTLLTNLRKAENVTLELIQTRQAANTNRISGYGKLKSAITALQTAAKALSKADVFGAVKATPGSDAISVSGSNTASPGQYSIVVDNLASAQTLTGSALDSRTSPLGADGKITVTLANGKEHSIDLTGKDTSLQGIMKAINADTDLGVSATIINNGDPDHPYQLQLTARDTGEQASVTKIRVEGNSALENILSFTSSGTVNDDGAPAGIFTEKAAVNAKVHVNGIEIISSSNVLKNTIEGLEITLNKASAEAVKLDVTRDDEVATKAIKEFVTAYNALNSTIKGLTAYDVEQQKGSALTGDSMVRRAQSNLRTAINVVSDQGDLRTLNSIGIKTDPKTGDLIIEDEKLAEALKTNLEDVKRLFIGDNGLGKRLYDAAEEYVKVDGFIENAKEGAEKIAKTLEKQYLAASDRIDTKIEMYRKQFLQLDKMVNQMQGLSSYLTQQLSMLGNMNSK